VNVVPEKFIYQSASVFLINYPVVLDCVFAELGWSKQSCKTEGYWPYRGIE